MNKIKDFFYNVNDILVVLVIVFAAALIISIKVNAIMTYPVTSGEVIQVPQEQSQPIAQQEPEIDISEEEQNANAAEEPEQTDGIADEPQSEPEQKPSGNYPHSLYVAYGESANSIGKNLAGLGLFESAEEFERYVEEKGVATKLQAGTFSIPQGASHEEVIKILTNQ